MVVKCLELVLLLVDKLTPYRAAFVFLLISIKIQPLKYTHDSF